ncbi:very short patch repair endonuclease [Pseudomonas sp. S37]|uniref:very short patch repair endonuclease n=1 Tax=Pseudomonas sp. S37 TaxID=2767449 RepID=UPI0019121051|nr:very short patch repair endonuclease [Pseudomonas sp. S37]
MVDIVDPVTRSRMMSGIKGKNTSPELVIRKALHARGFRFRIHTTHLPGKPDLILPKFKAAIFVHGCFWHGHDCRYFKPPKTRAEFWMGKIEKNKIRDAIQITKLNEAGWRTLIIWECAIRKMKRENSITLIDTVAAWLFQNSTFHELDEQNT